MTRATKFYSHTKRFTGLLKLWSRDVDPPYLDLRNCKHNFRRIKLLLDLAIRDSYEEYLYAKETKSPVAGTFSSLFIDIVTVKVKN